jgi:formylglycine-generating enzyme required for sulfatase activity
MARLRSHPLERGEPPAWASLWGEDRFGVFAGFTVGQVEQRMRWIPAGSFWMGSPESEEGRDSDEVRHEVTLTRGFWLADTPCTQALWQEVARGNPSRFPTPERPVEQVSWDDVEGFLRELEQRLPGLAPRLPTEAQWEYACRAETDGATYAGDLRIEGANNAPVLDAIAWYGGNSGKDLDLKEGASDSSDWPEKQYRHTRAATRKVATRAPNPWGLYDMLGNVWEWCADWYGPYETGSAIDSSGPDQGTYRVIRGGSWISYARLVRAASRRRAHPSYRWIALGFRLARGQE